MITFFGVFVLWLKNLVSRIHISLCPLNPFEVDSDFFLSNIAGAMNYLNLYIQVVSKFPFGGEVYLRRSVCRHAPRLHLTPAPPILIRIRLFLSTNIQVAAKVCLERVQEALSLTFC